MQIKERKLRLYGYLAVAVIFYFAFMLELFFSWRDDLLWLKTIAVTLIYTLAVWEPIRFIILWMRKRWQGVKNVRQRIWLTTLLVAPYAVLIGFVRIYLEDYLNIWGVPVGSATYYSYNIGVSLLIGLLQTAVYEGTYFFDEWNKTRAEAEELKRLNFQMQFDSLKVQIQPHFLFNTLNTLIGLMKLDIPRAIRFTTEMAHVYRYLLEANDRQLISLEDELKFTRAYFFLLKTRYPEGLFLEETGDIEPAQFQVPPLSLQVLIENAVKHNIITRDKPLHIKLEFRADLHRLIVSNNLQPKAQAFNSGLGLAQLRKKFELLNMPSLKITSAQNLFSVTIPIINSAKS